MQIVAVVDPNHREELVAAGSLITIASVYCYLFAFFYVDGV